ncbi:MAG: hypothetical protein DME57_05450 [Verrucomicrobia bacterium]|nr:MAG: hypothetical protein DME57_05450 [Verrucomicrobiota bacterium]
MYVAERGVYNIETKQIRTSNVRTEYHPYFLSGNNVTETSGNVYRVENATFTTDDSARPDFHLRARTVRVYENDHVVFQNVTFYVGRVPLFWWPYMYQSLNDAFSFSIAPADLSSWGPSVLTQVTFPITDDIKGRLRLDYRGRRGPAVGFDSDIDYGKDKASNLKLKTYYADDQNPDINPTALRRSDVPTDRYRLSLQDTTFFGHDIYGIVNVTKLSDPFIMQDFYQTEFRTDPVPDNVVAIAKTDPLYTLTAIARFQANDFFEQTERLPEVVLDIKRQPLFGTPVFYEGESGFADLHRSFAEGSGFESYGTTRLDTFHQLLYPNTYFGWLSVVPRAGFRATYYDKTRDLGNTVFANLDDPLIPNFIPLDPTPTNPVIDAGSGVRTVVDTGVEASFKLSRTWDDVANRAMGLDGLLHVIQPYSNFSYVHANGINPAAVLEFDRFEPSTQLRPLDFPQFTSIDSIASWTVWRNGIRNRLETRRDDVTVTWLELDTFVDVNFENPYDRRDYSNFFNKLRFTPLPWASLAIESQIPVFSSGFTEVNSTISIQPVANLQLSAGHRYLNDNPFFQHSSLFVVGGYYRVTDNWGFGFQEQYEGTIGVFQEQRYAIYRDLTNWVASFGAVVRDNTGNKKEYGVLLTFSLKAFPKFGFDLNFDPGSYGQ